MAKVGSVSILKAYCCLIPSYTTVTEIQCFALFQPEQKGGRVGRAIGPDSESKSTDEQYSGNPFQVKVMRRSSLEQYREKGPSPRANEEEVRSRSRQRLRTVSGVRTTQ